LQLMNRALATCWKYPRATAGSDTMLKLTHTFDRKV
jgi:hypothetical protein